MYTCSLSKAFYFPSDDLSIQTSYVFFLLNLHSSNRIFKQRQVLCIKTINEGVSPIMKVRKKLPGWVKRQILPLSVGLSHVLMAFNANANLSKLFCKF